LRQRGSKYKLGKGVYFGKDYTIHASYDGWVGFFQGRGKRTFVEVNHVPPR
jgi:ribosomal protein L27